MRPDRAAPVQPDVRDARSARSEGGLHRLPAARRPRRASSSTSRTCSSSRGGKPPFGIAQVGKSFRNEITPGNFLFRLREFEQMEMEFFVPPDEARAVVRVLDRGAVRAGTRASACARASCASASTSADERSHYSSATSDIEYLYPIGWSELEGVANRGDYDLNAAHGALRARSSSTSAQDGERYTPHVIEPAVSIERIFVALLVDAYDEEVVEERERTVLRLHPAVAPVKAAVLPLIAKRRGHGRARARALRGAARRRHFVEYDDGGADRAALPAAGRDRHAVGVHDRRRRRSRTTR